MVCTTAKKPIDSRTVLDFYDHSTINRTEYAKSMAENTDHITTGGTRRRFLAGVGITALAASAGCLGDTGDTSEEGRSNRVAELEALVEELDTQLAEARSENEQLQAEKATLEETIGKYQEQLESWNIWGFSEDDLSTLQSLATTWIDSIVAIDVVTDDGRWSVGTGWAYDDGIIATNAHVVQPRRLPDDIEVNRYDIWTHDGSLHSGNLLGYTFGRDDIFDNQEDIAFLSVPSVVTNRRVMNRGTSRDLVPDEPLLQIGHPWSVNYWVPAVGPFVSHREPFYVSNIPGQPGVSGSPVMDLAGEVIGMTWGGHYHQVPQRSIGEAPRPGDESILSTFEESVNGIHSYNHRIETAFEVLT